MRMNELFTQKKPIVDIRAIHLDLKGTPPTPQRLLELLHIFSAARYNAVLVEWEDTFPWSVDKRFRSLTAYSDDDVKRFHDEAKRLGIEIIPLVQCLGHMETPLRIKDYAHLREIPDESGVLNPLADGARKLIQDMVDDILRLIPDVKYFHLGGDEAWSFGSHPDTKAFIKEYGKGELYMYHVEPILDNLLSRGIRPILWHDMMINWESGLLKNLSNKADIMAWGYTGHPDDIEGHYNTKYIERLHEHGFNLWGATAYKSDSQNADLPVIPKREINALAWADISKRFGFKGLAVTAWSRWSTDRLQTAPIDAALDILTEIGVILHDGKLPDNGIEACVDALAEINEKERFLKCKNAMKQLSATRVQAWNNIQVLHEHIILCENDEKRRGSRQIIKYLKNLKRNSEELKKIVDEVKECFAGLMEPVWINEYLETRIKPINQQLIILEPKAVALDSN